MPRWKKKAKKGRFKVRSGKMVNTGPDHAKMAEYYARTRSFHPGFEAHKAREDAAKDRLLTKYFGARFVEMLERQQAKSHPISEIDPKLATDIRRAQLLVDEQHENLILHGNAFPIKHSCIIQDARHFRLVLFWQGHTYAFVRFSDLENLISISRPYLDRGEAMDAQFNRCIFWLDFIHIPTQ